MADVVVQTNPPPSAATSFLKTVLTLSIGAALGIVGYKMFGPPPVQVFSEWSPPSTPPRRKVGEGPGWYTLLYNYPPGHRDRRVKGLAGPFSTKAAAVTKAESESNVWYPTVRFYKKLPADL